MILKNKKFIISAAADGIGFSITKFIVQNGGKVYLTDIDQQKIDKIKRNKKFNNKIFASQLDANNYNHVREYFLSLSHLKKIDGLINNVGIAGPTKHIEQITNEEWQNTIQTNLNSHFYFTKFTIPFLKRNKSGSIINLSSTAGLFGFPQRTPYAASKWAIIGLTKSLAMELGKYKIRVNAICPGSVEGDRMKRVVSAKAKLLKVSTNKLQKEFESMTSIKSFVSKEDIASMAVYLLSNNSINISGQALAVDGHTERMA